MASGWETKLTELLGEHLVAARLCREGLMTSFTPKNAPTTDLLVSNKAWKVLPVQLKTIRGGTWQMHADDFLEIEFQPLKDGRLKQVIKGKLQLPNPKMPYVFVKLSERPGFDLFYVCQESDVQKIISRIYSKWMKKCKGIRPKNPKSTHCGLHHKDLLKFKDNWPVITAPLS